MDLLNVMLQRRSVRKYSGEAIPDEKIEKILQAGLLAPSSHNRKPCEFYVIKDKELLKKLSKAKQIAGSFIADANAAIAVFADADKADTWVEDCSIAMSYMDLMAAEQGIGSCWVQMHMRSSLLGKDAEANVREALSVPNNYRIVGILSLGLPEKEIKYHTLDEANFSRVHYL